MDELEKKEQEDTSIEVDAPENADTPENNEGDKHRNDYQGNYYRPNENRKRGS